MQLDLTKPISNSEKSEPAKIQSENNSIVSAKEQLKRFVQATVNSSPKEPIHFSFSYPGTKLEATKYVHAMRSQLTRYRDNIIANGRKPLKFKMLIVSIESQSKTITEVTLTRHKQINADLMDVFDDLIDL